MDLSELYRFSKIQEKNVALLNTTCRYPAHDRMVADGGLDDDTVLFVLRCDRAVCDQKSRRWTEITRQLSRFV